MVAIEKRMIEIESEIETMAMFLTCSQNQSQNPTTALLLVI